MNESLEVTFLAQSSTTHYHVNGGGQVYILMPCHIVKDAPSVWWCRELDDTAQITSPAHSCPETIPDHRYRCHGSSSNSVGTNMYVVEFMDMFTNSHLSFLSRTSNLNVLFDSWVRKLYE